MAIWRKADSSKDIVVGGATVGQGGDVPANYHDPQRALVYGSGDALNYYQNLDGRFRAGEWPEDSAAASAVASSGDVATGADNDAVAVSYSAVANRSHVISGLAWAYQATPTSGEIIIQDGSSVVFSLPILTSGPDTVDFPGGKRGTRGLDMTVTLADGGPGVSGVLSVKSHWLD